MTRSFKAKVKVRFPKGFRPLVDGVEIVRLFWYGPDDWELLDHRGYVVVRKEGKKIERV